MLELNPNVNTERENYKLLTGTIIPRPIAFVTTQSNEGIVNGAPFSYFNIVSSNPPLISISIQRIGDKMKDTARNIYESKEFVVHVVDLENVHEINKTAATLPSSESELDLTNLTQVSSKMVSVPGINEAKVRFECKLVKAVTLGGEEAAPGCDLFIGEVVLFHIDDSIYESGRINAKKLNAVSRLAGANYAKIGELFSIERPK
ncbi:flavin reductase family protein [Rummeliibacillus sp. JY-2-4R]